MKQQKQRMRPRFLLKVSEQNRKIGAWHALNIHRPWQKKVLAQMTTKKVAIKTD
jgi:hypothetical protein